jgi:hypothetical protein
MLQGRAIVSRLASKAILNAVSAMQRCLVLCWFWDAGNDETLRRLNWPASKKRQGTKRRLRDVSYSAGVGG